MRLTDITDNTVEKDGDIKRRVLISYPLTPGVTKPEKRINAFITRIVNEYKKDAKKSSLYTYNRLGYRICRADPPSLFFESERTGRDGLFLYTPFSVTFSADGRALPLCPDKAVVCRAKKYFAQRGLRVRRRDMKYSYYMTDDEKTVIYVKAKEERRAKKSLTEYRF